MSYFGQFNERFTIVDVDGVILSAGDEVVIHEPESYADQNFSLKRDIKYRGFNVEYSDEDLTLLFDRVKFTGETYSPYTFIKSALDAGGYDITLLLRAYRTPTGGSEEYQEWRILGYSKEDYAYSCRLKKIRYNDKLRTRFEVGIDAESSENLDGVSDTPLTLIDIPFHSRTIQLITETSSPNIRIIEIPVTENTNTVVEISLGNIVLNEIRNFNPLIDFNHGNISNIRENLGAIYSDLQANGFMSIDIALTSIFYETTPSSVTWTMDAYLYLDIYENKSLVSSNLIHSNSGAGSSDFQAVNLSFNSTYDINVKQGQELYFYVKLSYTNGFGSYSSNADYEIQSSDINITFKSFTFPAKVKGSLIYDLLNKLIQKSIGDESYNPVRSDLIDNGGIAELNFITTGNKIRQLTKPLISDIENIIDFLRVRYNAGFAIVRDSGNTYVQVEQAKEFYKDVEILDLGTNYESLVISENKDLMINEIELGYNNFAKENEDGSVQGFNTKRGYLLPVNSSKKKETLLTNVITDDSEIERVRRLDIKSDESDESDEKLFAVKLQVFNSSNTINNGRSGSDTANTDLQFIALDTSTKKVTLQGYYLESQIETATNFYLATGLSSHVTYTIVDISFSTFENKTVIEVSEALPFDTSKQTVYSFYFDVDVYLPERVEGYTSITNVVDKYSLYNLHHAPSNILHQWFDFLGSGINEKAGAEKIKLTDRKNNVDISFGGRDKTNNVFSEGIDYTLTNLRTYNATYLNWRKYQVECSLDYDSQFKVIIDALSGEFGSSKDWGYLSITDNDGVSSKFYPTFVQFQPNNVKVKITGWGKKV